MPPVYDREYWIKNGLGCVLPTVVVAAGLAATFFAVGVWPLGVVFALVVLVALGAAASDLVNSRRTPAEREQRLRQANERASRAQQRAAGVRSQRAEVRASKLAGPPPGAVPPAPGALFVRLTEERWRGLPHGVTSVDLTCGRCGYPWSMPRNLVTRFQSETGPGSGLAAFNNPAAQARRHAAQQALSCPRCGSIEPGVWVAP